MKTPLLFSAATLTFVAALVPATPVSAQNYTSYQHGRAMMQPDASFTHRSRRGYDPLVAQVQVILVQKDLYHHVHHNQVDGIYGEETRHAVQDFQRLVGLPTTGMLDAPTLEALGLQEAPSGQAAPRAASPPQGAPVASAPADVGGPSDVLTSLDVAEILKVTEADVIELIGSNKLAAKKIGGHWRVLRSAVDEFFRSVEAVDEEPEAPEAPEAKGEKHDHKHDHKDGKAHDH